MIKLTFQRALFASFLVHIFFFSTIVIVVTPVELREERFSTINFIGSILDKDLPVYHGTGDVLKHGQRRNVAGKLLDIDNKPSFFSEERLRHAKLTATPKRPYGDSVTEIISERKDLPKEMPLSIEAITPAQSPEIRSEAAARQILFRPPAPKINRAFGSGNSPYKGEKFEIKLRFLVSPTGKVVFIEKIKSCGYSDIDLIGTRYIEKWQFSSLEPGKPKKNQEGIILLELEAQ